jgi:hypothetical protein
MEANNNQDSSLHSAMGLRALVGAQICPTNFLAAYSTLVLVWLVANILVAYGILPTLLTPPSQILPTFWPM